MTLELSASDIDSNDLTFSATNGDSDITVDGTTLTITPPANYFGSEDVTVTVSDGELEDSTTFTLTVTPVNDAPIVLNPVEDMEVDEDSEDIVVAEVNWSLAHNEFKLFESFLCNLFVIDLSFICHLLVIYLQVLRILRYQYHSYVIIIIL